MFCELAYFFTMLKSKMLHSLLSEKCLKIRIYFYFLGLVALFIWNNPVVSKFDFPKLCLSRCETCQNFIF